ncbi:MAG: translocation/assembly module TamB domain-containing protein, partial [Gammaproteobacteria bacterium]|nr:translocation/assembly module TamB domain-containing protein [Gammaproteobacteria bacterium]NNJ83899.1 hypothetical protein [Gammaproteobacteria bacterium]
IHHEIPHENSPPDSDPITRLPLPLALRIERVQVTDLHVVSGAAHHRAQRLIAGPVTFSGGAAPVIIREFGLVFCTANTPSNGQQSVNFTEKDNQENLPCAAPLELALDIEVEPVAPFTYKVNGSGHTTGPDGMPLTGEGNLYGNASGVVVERFSANVRKGRLEGAGQVEWFPEPRWDITLRAQDIDPNVYWSIRRLEQENDWHGSLDLEGRVRGHMGGNGLDMILEIKRLNGMLRGHPLAATGRMIVAGTQLEVQELKLNAGDNRLRIHGTSPVPVALLQQFGTDSVNPDPPDAMDMAFEIHAPMPNALWPGLTGRLQGKGKLDGSLSDPEIHLKMTGREVAYQGYKAAALQADLALHPATSTASRADIEVTNAVLADNRFPRLWVHGSGRLALEQIALGFDFSCEPGTDVSKFLCANATGKPAHEHPINDPVNDRTGRLALELDGGLKDGIWSGRLKRADIQRTSLGNWHLVEPVTSSFSIDAGHIGCGSVTASCNHKKRACWRQDKARICTEGSWLADGAFQATGNIADLPWDIFDPWLPETVDVRGDIAGHFDIRSTGKNGDFDANLTVTPKPGTLIYRAPNRAPLETTFQDARLTASYTQGGLHAAARLGIAEQGLIEGDLQVGAASAGSPLQGTLQAKLPDLAPLAGLAPQADKVEGGLSLDFTAGGTINTPILHGRAVLTQGAVELPVPGIRLHDISIVAEGRGKQPLEITGSATSGPGRVSFDGQVRHLLGGSPHVELSVRGDTFQVLRLPEAQVLVSPNLHIVSNQGEIAIDGKISIPEAKLELEALPKASIAVSEDEVIVGETNVEPHGQGSKHAVRA